MEGNYRPLVDVHSFYGMIRVVVRPVYAVLWLVIPNGVPENAGGFVRRGVEYTPCPERGLDSPV